MINDWVCGCVYVCTYACVACVHGDYFVFYMACFFETVTPTHWVMLPFLVFVFFFFLISNKTSLILKKRHPSTQGIYKGEQIKNESYKSQVYPKEKKNGFSTQRTIQVRFGKKEAWCRE